MRQASKAAHISQLAIYVYCNDRLIAKVLRDRVFSTKRTTQVWRTAKTNEVVGQNPEGDKKVAPQSEVTYLVALPKPCAPIRSRHIEGNGAWIDFHLPAAQDGESKSWANGNHWQYGIRERARGRGLPEYQLGRHPIHLP